MFTTHFYGVEISDEGKRNKRVDYRTFSQAFNHVCANSLFEHLSKNLCYEMENGCADYSDEIEEIGEALESLRFAKEQLQDAIEKYEGALNDFEYYLSDVTDTAENGGYCRIKSFDAWDYSHCGEEAIERMDEIIEALEEERDRLEDADGICEEEVFQYYLVDDAGAEIIKEFTSDPLFYFEEVDAYFWGVTHFGTAWDYVMTGIKCDPDALRVE